MTTIEQLPQKIDSNVTICPPGKIEIKYFVNLGWYIEIDGDYVKENTKIVYFQEAGEPLQWLIDRHLVVTKAYKELEKAVKKVHNNLSKHKIENDHE